MRQFPRPAVVLACAVVTSAFLAAPAATAKVEREHLRPTVFRAESAQLVLPHAKQAESVNPLANRPWGVYKGNGDQAWLPYTRATGKKKKLLGKIALAPKSKWYGG